MLSGVPELPDFLQRTQCTQPPASRPPGPPGAAGKAQGLESEGPGRSLSFLIGEMGSHILWGAVLHGDCGKGPQSTQNNPAHLGVALLGVLWGRADLSPLGGDGQRVSHLLLPLCVCEVELVVGSQQGRGGE